MDYAITIIQQVGFPIFVAILLLWRVDRMHIETALAVQQLTDAVRAMNECLRDVRQELSYARTSQPPYRSGSDR